MSEWVKIPSIPESDLHRGPMDTPKRRKLGIRFRKQQAREWGFAMPSQGSAELYDVESGETFDGVIGLEVEFTFKDPGAIRAKLEIFVAAVDSYERPEEHLIPLKE